MNLVLIVKNEAAVIDRCLESVRPYLSHWTICDTGSTDGTPELIERFMAEAGIPGKLYRDKWVNFAHNRTLAMRRARGTADYHLLLDADMVLRVQNAECRVQNAGALATSNEQRATSPGEVQSGECKVQNGDGSGVEGYQVGESGRGAVEGSKLSGSQVGEVQSEGLAATSNEQGATSPGGVQSGECRVQNEVGSGVKGCRLSGFQVGEGLTKETQRHGEEGLTTDGADGNGLGGEGKSESLVTTSNVASVSAATLGGFPELKEDAYLIRFEGATDYAVIRLVSDRHEWRYVGVTHEYVHSDTAAPPHKLAGVSVVHYEDGGSRSDKYERDIRLLTEEFERLSRVQSGISATSNEQRATSLGEAKGLTTDGTDGNGSGELKSEGREEESQSLVIPPSGTATSETNLLARTVFYLAQSYRDAKQFERALDFYEKRVLLGGWEEETWVALYQLGRIQQILGYDWRVVLNSYLQAYNFRPWRLESVYQIARFYREHQQWSLGYHFARLCTEAGYPEDILFVERPVYEYLLPYEYAVCCQQTGRTEEARRILVILKEQGKAPADLLENLAGAIGGNAIDGQRP